MKKIILTVVCFFLLSINTFAQYLNTKKLDSLFQILETKDKFMGSIAVAENGKLLYTKSIGKDDLETNKHSTTESKYRIGSISKTFTSCLIFKAIEEKKLSLNQNIAAFFPTIENAEKITIGNLLNHRSGIHNFTNDKDYATYNTQPKSEKEMVEIITKGKSDFEPNSKSDYSNSNYVLLSYILEKTYKKSYKEILNAKIIRPLGLKNTYFGNKINSKNNESYSYNHTNQWQKQTETDLSIPMGAGAIVSNPTDLLVFINGLFSNKIISKSSLDQMKMIKDNFGMGIFQFTFHDKIGLGHTGGIDGFRSVVAYFPESKFSVALISNGMIYTTDEIMKATLNTYYGKPFEIPTFETRVLKTEDLDPYLGEYSSLEFPLKIVITKKDTKLFAQATGQSEFPLEATEKDKFEYTLAGIKLDFKPIEKQMILNQAGKSFRFSKK